MVEHSVAAIVSEIPPILVFCEYGTRLLTFAVLGSMKSA